MKLKIIYAYLATPWYHVRPLSPQHRSREAWIEHCRKTGKDPEGKKS